MSGGAPMATLPPGRHGIPTELVRESQRRRLMTASAERIAEAGFGGVTVTAVAKRARVSTRSFYKLFESLDACVLAAFEADASLLAEEVESASASGGPAEALAAALRMLDSEAGMAALLCSEPPAPQRGLREARGRLVADLAAALAPGDPLGTLRVEAALAALASQVRGGDGPLSELAPTLEALVLG